MIIKSIAHFKNSLNIRQKERLTLSEPLITKNQNSRVMLYTAQPTPKPAMIILAGWLGLSFANNQLTTATPATNPHPPIW